MATLTIVVAEILPGLGATIKVGQAGVALKAGEPVREDPTDNGNLKLCRHSGTVVEADCVGITIEAAVDDAACQYITLGDLTLGSILVAGNVYELGANLGDIADVNDSGSGHFRTILGIAKSISILAININISGVVQV